MPKGRSYASDQWESFEKGGHSFVADDFVHDKTFVFKAKLEKVEPDGQKFNAVSGVNLKESFSEKPEGLSGSGEAKFWYNVWDRRSIYGKVGTNSNMTVQYDHGISQFKNISNNLYTGLEVNRIFTERIGWIGIQFFKGKLWSFNSRLVFDFTKKNIAGDYKVGYSYANFKYNSYTCVDISHQILSNTGFLFAWTPFPSQGLNKWKNSFFLRFENNKRAERLHFKHFFENIYVNWNAEVNSTQTVGLEAKVSLKEDSFKEKRWLGKLDSLWLASEWRLGESVVKAKISKDWTSALTIKNKLGSYGTYSLGVQASDLGTKNRFKFGVQMDLNL